MPISQLSSDFYSYTSSRPRFGDIYKHITFEFLFIIITRDWGWESVPFSLSGIPVPNFLHMDNSRHSRLVTRTATALFTLDLRYKTWLKEEIGLTTALKSSLSAITKSERHRYYVNTPDGKCQALTHQLAWIFEWKLFLEETRKSSCKYGTSPDKKGFVLPWRAIIAELWGCFWCMMSPADSLFKTSVSGEFNKHFFPYRF